MPLDPRVTRNAAPSSLQILSQAVGAQPYKGRTAAAGLGVAPSGLINQGSWMKDSIPFSVWHWQA